MTVSFPWKTASALGLAAAGLATYHAWEGRRMAEVEADLFAPGARRAPFSEAHLAHLPKTAQRYLRHAIAPGTPLAPAVRLSIRGTMTPTPGGAPVDLTATETLAPRRGFVWTAETRMKGLPLRVRDHYVRGEGAVRVEALGLVPLPGGGSGPDVTRSSRGRLVGEAVWCPTALVHPTVRWEAVDDERVRFTLPVDGEAVTVTLRVDAEGAPLEVSLLRWGDVDGPPARPLPYGFRVDAEGAFDGVTIPTRLVGGWHYGTPGFDPAVAASFAVDAARFAVAPGRLAVAEPAR